MKFEKICDLCELELKLDLDLNKFDQYTYDCPRCGLVFISREASINLEHSKEKKLKSLLSGVTRYRTENHIEEVIISSKNFKEHLDASFVPRNISQKIDLILKHFENKSDYFGHVISINAEMDYPLGFCMNSIEFNILLNLLIEQNLLKTPQQGKLYLLDYKGWIRLDESRKTIEKKRQAFIAMWFDSSMSEVYENGFHKAIKDCGYEPLRIDRKEHINKIDDEIIAEIKNSGFLVADFTNHRGGVYYEAGFAHGLGVPVIWTCKKCDIKDLHFDTRQYNHIDWETSEELYTKLVNRIKAIITI